MICHLRTAFLCVSLLAHFTSVRPSNAADPLVWKLRDHELRWAKNRKQWEKAALSLAANPSVNLHLNQPHSARAAYFEAVVYGGFSVIEHCLLRLEGKDAKDKGASSFVLMARKPYEGTGEWEFAWAIVEPPHPKAPTLEGVLPIQNSTSQADIWRLLEEFEACPSAQPKKEGYECIACVLFEDIWSPFLGDPLPSKGSDEIDESKLRQPESRSSK